MRLPYLSPPISESALQCITLRACLPRGVDVRGQDGIGLGALSIVVTLAEMAVLALLRHLWYKYICPERLSKVNSLDWKIPNSKCVEARELWWKRARAQEDESQEVNRKVARGFLFPHTSSSRQIDLRSSAKTLQLLLHDVRFGVAGA